MGYTIEGDYFEACGCAVTCPCIFLGPATRGSCDAFLAWHVTRGEKDGVDLSGLNAALAVHTGEHMTDGDWKVGLYLDERASAAQAEALGAIFSGAAGGHLANLAPLIGTVAGVSTAPIAFTADGNNRRVSVGSVLDVAVEQVTGMDGTNPAVITNPLLGAVTQPLRQAKSTQVRYADHWTFEADGTNGYITEFSYAG